MDSRHNHGQAFTIGVLAKQAGVAIDTIRHYEREGLLPSPLRRSSGYRQYDAGAIERLRFIRRARDLGFTLEEVSSLLALSTDREHGVEGVKRRANERLTEINQRIALLIETRDRLTQLVEACPGHGAPECCPILSSIHDRALVEHAPQPAHAAESAAAKSCCGGAPESTGTADQSGHGQ